MAQLTKRHLFYNLHRNKIKNEQGLIYNCILAKQKHYKHPLKKHLHYPKTETYKSHLIHNESDE